MKQAISTYAGHNFIFTLLISAALGMQAENTILGPQPDWNNELDFNEIERRLHTEAIVERKDMRSFLKESNKTDKMSKNPPELVVLESGLKAVFKTCSGCYGEVAAYKAAKALGLHLVPPTVLRTINGKTGSLQFYVASKIDLIKVGRGIYEKLNPKDLSDMELFQYIFNRWDANRANQIVTEHNGNYYIALIDNAENTYLNHKPKLGLKSVAASTLISLKKINNQKALEEIWSDYLPVEKTHAGIIIERTLKRIKLLLQMAKKKKSMIVTFS